MAQHDEPITLAEAERRIVSIAAIANTQIEVSVESLILTIELCAQQLAAQGMNKGIVIKAMLDTIPRESLIWGAFRSHVLRSGWPGDGPDGTNGHSPNGSGH